MFGMLKNNENKNENIDDLDKIKINNQPFQLSDLLHTLTNKISVALEKNNNTIYYGVKSKLGRYVIGDHTYIGQVLEILLLRSCGMSKDSEIFLKIEEDKNKFLIFSITNKKGSINSEQDKHYMQNPDENQVYLFTKAKMIANAMNGDINTKSTWLSGTIFTFTIPFYKDKDNRSVQENIKTVLTNKHVLYIGDSKNDIQNMQDIFKTYGVDIDNMSFAQFEKKKPDLNSYDLVLIKSKALKHTHVSFLKNFYNDRKSTLKIIVMHEFLDQTRKVKIAESISHAELFGPTIMGDIEEILYNLFILKRESAEVINNVEEIDMEGFEIVANKTLSKEDVSIYKGSHVAIVQSNEAAIRNIETILSIEGVILHIVNNGIEMLELLKNEKIDIIFTDVNFPLLDGYEMSKKIRANIYWKDIPIIFVSLLPNEKNMKKMSLAGISGAFPVRYTDKHFYTVLKKYLIPKKEEVVEVIETIESDDVKYPVNKQILDVNAGIKSAGGIAEYRALLLFILEDMDNSIQEMRRLINKNNSRDLQRFSISSHGQYSEIHATGVCNTLIELNDFIKSKQRLYLEDYIGIYRKSLIKLKQEIENYIKYQDSLTYDI